MKLRAFLKRHWLGFSLLALLLMAAGWPAVNTPLPGSSGQILYNNAGAPGAKTLQCSDLSDAGSGCVGAGAGTITLSGDASGSGTSTITVTNAKVNGVSYPSSPSTNTVPVVTAANTITYEAVPNTALANSSVTIAGHAVALGASQTLSCADLSDAGSGCTGTTSSGGTVSSVATGFGLTGGTITTSGTVSMVAPGADDQVYVSDSTSAATWRTLPSCPDSGGNHFNYTASTNSFSCGTSTSGLTGNQTVTLSGDASGSGATAITVTNAKVNGVAYPASPSTDTVPVVTASNTITYETVPNAALANSSVTIAGHSVSLGSSQTLSCSDLTDAGTGCSNTPSGYVIGTGGPLFSFTAPVNGDFAWINQSHATLASTSTSVSLTDTGHSNADSLHIRKKSAPSTPYTITAFFLQTQPAKNYHQMGLVWRQSSDGKLVSCAYGFNGSIVVTADKWSSATAFSANYTAVVWYGTAGIWLQIKDDGTNRKCLISNDGTNFTQIHSVGRTDYMTGDEVGFYINDNDQSGTTTYNSYMVLLSWLQGS